MSSPTVLIIGCGIAGPVLAILLKREGYNPIVFEKVQALGDAGASLMIQPNGMKILNLINPNRPLPIITPLQSLWHGTASGKTLGHSTLPSSYVDRYTQPASGIKRSVLNLHLKTTLQEHGIPLYEGYQLENIHEHAHQVTAIFTNGESITGSFLIGCDGIKSSTRKLLLSQKVGIAEGPPTFTGLIQVAGISKNPRSMAQRDISLSNWYGEGVHVVAYPISAEDISWAVTIPDTEGEDSTWRAATAGTELEILRGKLRESLSGFEDCVLEMVNTADRIISYGLFDRREVPAEQWFSDRVVLVGDAAHPTSPHLGQGANQALEDCYHLCRMLPDLSLDEANRGVVEQGLSGIFEEFARLRQPRTSMLVREARQLGKQRVVVGGPERCRERDAGIADAWKDEKAVARGLYGLFREPF
ncbi:FAD/NAD(P)-binding domain-containing protein [Aspergillus eucalypticola CBS 122712]|uniref:FAD/NAD(P)-binding domain-containing protein n=1 Tax=Aspergillus eucalypticola (strain CBS 122712 / IBT 29274) TaxID=1448314 RepID=A0A317VQX1_ASPEC|nr:FAD/NAD(P)-binding domain-containing protein [Aspergillus eucalypticola CBS 122712]PWY75681.1 FAD/NAD(P)-binding domain-containing protein [Aspergillus eucalypticola CBS 122712]